MSEWQYFAIRLNGDGTQTILDTELPLTNVRPTSTLSGPDGLTATITPEIASLIASDGRPIFEEWSTLILAVKDGLIRGGGILEVMGEDGPKLTLDCVGPSGYAKSMPYTGEWSRIGVDPMAVVRHIWDHLQGQPGGDMGAVIETNSSPVRVGTPERDVKFDTQEGESVEFKAGPYVLAWWNTHDLGRELDDLAKTTPFQYRTSWNWVGERAVPTLEYSYPALGVRQHNLRFVVGENVYEVPSLTYDGAEYASDVLVLGAGSGREVRNGMDSLPKRTRLRRVIVLEDKGIPSNAKAKQVAQAELRLRQGDVEIDDLVIVNHPNAPLGEYEVGDEILVTTEAGWSGSMDIWCKIIGLEINPETDEVHAQVVRTEKIG